MRKGKSIIKKVVLLAVMVLALSGLTGCIKPYDTPEFVTIEASQTAFVVSLIGDTGVQDIFESEELLASAKVATKEVQITHRWVQTGRRSWQGEYRANVKLIIVDRAPVTREWTSEKDTGTTTANQAIYAESKESIGFSVGVNCSAQIDEGNAAKFLYRYNNMTLSEIMDTEIRARVESDFVEQCSHYTLEELLVSKDAIMEYVREDVTTYFAERGITINNLGMKEGLTYEDDTIQQSINDKYSSEQKIITAQNDADAKKVTAQGTADANLIEAEAKAKAVVIAAEAEAEANAKIAESLTSTYIEYITANKWSGNYPYVVGSGANIVDLSDMISGSAE